VIGLDELIGVEERQADRRLGGTRCLSTPATFARIDRRQRPPSAAPRAGQSTSCRSYTTTTSQFFGMDGIQDVMPSGYATPDLTMPAHCVSLVAMHLWLIENASLNMLASTLRSPGNSGSIFFAMQTSRMVGVTSSVVNPSQCSKTSISLGRNQSPECSEAPVLSSPLRRSP
jgi:hypothetical protein